MERKTEENYTRGGTNPTNIILKEKNPAEDGDGQELPIQNFLHGLASIYICRHCTYAFQLAWTTYKQCLEELVWVIDEPNNRTRLTATWESALNTIEVNPKLLLPSLMHA